MEKSNVVIGAACYHLLDSLCRPKFQDERRYDRASLRPNQFKRRLRSGWICQKCLKKRDRDFARRAFESSRPMARKREL